jgi:peptidoglycan/xylan/chitin deacetylase (PgdA/CDA1 family)
MISFTFDDITLEAMTGAEILKAHGVHGTFYVAAGLAERRDSLGPYAGGAQVKHLIEAGHEVGCHTYSHLDCGQADRAAIAADLDRNRRTLLAWGAPTPATFAYPFGDVSLSAKMEAAQRFRLARAVHPGLVRGGVDLNQAPAVSIDGPDGEGWGAHWLERARAQSGWLILISHGMRPAMSEFTTAPLAFKTLVQAALAQGIEVVIVAEGARRLAP